jgi:hypothetical protein
MRTLENKTLIIPCGGKKGRSDERIAFRIRPVTDVPSGGWNIDAVPNAASAPTSVINLKFSVSGVGDFYGMYISSLTYDTIQYYANPELTDRIVVYVSDDTVPWKKGYDKIRIAKDQKVDKAFYEWFSNNASRTL